MTKFLIWQPNAYGQSHNNYYFITALVLTTVPFVAPSSIITTDTLKPEISSHAPEATIHKRNYIVHLHEKISATSLIIRDVVQPTEVTLYFPSNVASQLGLSIKISDSVPKFQERRVVVYVVLDCACCVRNTLCETDKSPSCLCCGGSMFAIVSLCDAGSSVTNYGTINSARTRTDCRIRVRKPLVQIRPQTIYLDVAFLSPARLVLSIMQETLPCTFLSLYFFSPHLTLHSQLLTALFNQSWIN